MRVEKSAVDPRIKLLFVNRGSALHLHFLQHLFPDPVRFLSDFIKGAVFRLLPQILFCIPDAHVRDPDLHLNDIRAARFKSDKREWIFLALPRHYSFHNTGHTMRSTMCM